MTRFALAAAFGLALVARVHGAPPVAFPAPAVDDSLGPRAEQSIIVAGGCFWGVQAVFQHVKGVVSATSGYAGGKATTASYHLVSTGATGHAEAVKITYDPAQVSLGRLLQVFFSVAHDPTQLNRQGPDSGPQYRSAIFFQNERQQQIAVAYAKQIDAAKALRLPIVTEIASLQGFFPAESYHQDYLDKHPNDPYIVMNDLPKLGRLRDQYPSLYVDRK